MRRFIEGADRGQSTLLPECLDDWVDESNPVRAVDAFVDALKLAELGFKDVGRPSPGGPGITLRRCSSYIFTAISTAFNRAVVWNAKRAAIWK